MYNVSTAAPCSVANSNNVAGLACKCKTGFKGTITWSGATASGSCKQTKCTGANANAPANGAVSKSKSDEHGSKATFKCNDGFKLNGATPVTCSAANADVSWPTPKIAPQCARKSFSVNCKLGFALS